MMKEKKFPMHYKKNDFNHIILCQTFYYFRDNNFT